MNFENFKKKDLKFLNLGALTNTHPNKNYLNYIGINPPNKFQNKIIDLKSGKLIDHPENTKLKHGCNIIDIQNYPNTIIHDIEKPFPLPDNCVDRILSEHCFEHIEITKYPQILKELYRILKPGGVFRLAVPDYLHPNLKHHISMGYDTSNNLHITLTNYNLLKPYFDNTKFKVYYLHYWKDNETFVENKINYSNGYIKRTPDNDERNKKNNSFGRLLVTSFICDLIK